MQNTAEKVVDLQEYRKAKEMELRQTTPLEESKDSYIRPYWSITMPSQYFETYIIPDIYKKIWNVFWAIGCTIFILLGLL